jgi:hypothetical protein
MMLSLSFSVYIGRMSGLTEARRSIISEEYTPWAREKWNSNYWNDSFSINSRWLVNDKIIIITRMEIGWGELNCRHFFHNEESPLIFSLFPSQSLTLSQLMKKKNSDRDDGLSGYIYPCRVLFLLISECQFRRRHASIIITIVSSSNIIFYFSLSLSLFSFPSNRE